MPVLVYPHLDPIIVRLGPLAIHWYALAYIAGLLLGWRIMRRLVRREPVVATALQVDDFLTWATLGVVLGGRAGYVLFYQPAYYFAHPRMIPAVWDGGMSFHGGMIGVIVATAIYCWKHRIPLLGFADRLCVVVPIGLGFGRIANFINGELWGRPAPAWVPFRMIYPQAGPQPRFPSEIYEAFLEGLCLFLLLWFAARRPSVRARFGMLSGLFLVGYACARILGEFSRQPDAFLGYLAFGVTMGQILSLPMLAVGIPLLLWARSRPPRA